MKKLDLSIIIVSYNTAEITAAAIQSVIDTTKKISYEIIVVDNASTDGSVELVRGSQFSVHRDKLKVIENKENVGFSKANNIGIKKSSGRFVLFLNSDTVVHEGTLDGMVEWMDRHADVGAATCKLVLPNGELDDGSHRGFPTPLRSLFHFSGIAKIFPNSQFFNGYHLGWKDMDKAHEIEALVGAFMLVKREAGEQVGWWDEDYFWYGDDLDFCYRLRQEDWKIYYVPEFTTLHYKGVSGGIKKVSKSITKASQDTKRKATEARFEAMKIFYKKHYFKKYPEVVTALVFIGIEAKKHITKKRLGLK